MADATDISRASIAAIRSFNRFYTQKLGVLGQGLLDTPYTLSEARALYEIASRRRALATDLSSDLGIDFGYLSRILARFERSGLVRRERSARDQRKALLRLTDKGRRAFRVLDRRARAEVSGVLAPLPLAEQAQLETHLTEAQRILSRSAVPSLNLRAPRPGDLGWIIQRHGELYAREYGWDLQFERLVAGICTGFLKAEPDPRQRCWIAERGDRRVGSVMLVRHSAKVAKLRLLLVEPSERGRGTGSELIGACLAFARHAGYRSVMLWTQQNLVAARRLYVRTGFERISANPHHSFGADLIEETWRKPLR
jgi:DNA-binding MarR family transcriptional regulator/GNAT superfamily N-acetyltransferase